MSQDSWSARRIIDELERPVEDRRPLAHRIQREAPAAALAEALSQAEEPFTRLLVATIIGRQRDPAAIDALLQASVDPDSDVRGEVADAIGKMFGYVDTPPLDERPRVLARLLEWWQVESVSGVRSRLVGTLALHGDGSVRPLLQRASTDPDPYVRRHAAWGLGWLDQTPHKS